MADPDRRTLTMSTSHRRNSPAHRKKPPLGWSGGSERVVLSDNRSPRGYRKYPEGVCYARLVGLGNQGHSGYGRFRRKEA